MKPPASRQQRDLCLLWPLRQLSTPTAPGIAVEHGRHQFPQGGVPRVRDQQLHVRGQQQALRASQTGAMLSRCGQMPWQWCDAWPDSGRKLNLELGQTNSAALHKSDHQFHRGSSAGARARLGFGGDCHKALLQQRKLHVRRHVRHQAPVLAQQVARAAHQRLVHRAALQRLQRLPQRALPDRVQQFPGGAPLQGA